MNENTSATRIAPETFDIIDGNTLMLLIHHTRKLHDDDPLNTISGSMGLSRFGGRRFCP